MTSRLTRFAALAFLAGALVSCSDDTPNPAAPDPGGELASIIAEVRAILPTGLHSNAGGMRDWYNQPDGYGAMIGVDYDGLGCAGCHIDVASENVCFACHTDLEAAVAGEQDIDYQASCVGACHGRQRAEIAIGLPDVHRAAGMTCGDCHTSAEVHGDGVEVDNMFENPQQVTCEQCHGPDGSAPAVTTIQAHTLHGDDLSCEACHQVASVSCYNCHFADEIENNRKVAYSKFSDWVFLGNYRGKVYPMNFQSVEYEGQTFNAWGPFHGHTITKQGRDCNACHGNDVLAELDANGSIKLVEWDTDSNRLVYRRGIIPMVPGFQNSFRFDYVTKDGTGWVFLEEGPDQTQIRYGTPLTEDQLDLLRIGM